MTADGGTTSVVAVCTLAGLVVNVVLQPLMGEWRATRQRKWMEKQAHEQEARTHERLQELNHTVRQVGDTAEAAYHAANNVNEWRGELMVDLKGVQQRLLKGQEELRGHQVEIKAKVEEQLQRPDIPALVILASPPSEELP